MEATYKYFRHLNEKQILLLIFAISIFIRAIGIDYGYIYPDERINYSARVLAGNLVPKQHFYPPLLYYITAFAFAVLYAIGRLIPIWHNLTEFREHYFTDPTIFIITARFVVCLISATVAPLFYSISRELGLNRNYSLILGVLGIFIPVMVLHSHYSKVDVPLAFSVILIFYLSIKQTIENTKINPSRYFTRTCFFIKCKF